MTDSFRKLLAINFGGIGDEILFLPTLKTIRDAHPNWHITLLLEPRSRSISEITNLINDFITFDIKKKPLLSRDLLDLIGLLKGGNYDYVLSSGSSPLVSALLFLSGIPERIGYDAGILARILLTKPVRLNKNQYAASMYKDLSTGLSLTEGIALPHIIVPEASTNLMREFLSRQLSKTEGKNLEIVLIHPGTSLLALQKGIIKTWATEHWTALIERLTGEEGIQIILAGGPDDAETIESIQLALAERGLTSRVISAYGATRSLADLAALIQLSDVLVCVDSGPMHIAVALSKPLVSLFGPTDHRRLLPVSPTFKALSSKIYTRQKESNQFGSQPKDGRGVQLPPDIVFQSVQDQLLLSRGQAHSHESPG